MSRSIQYKPARTPALFRAHASLFKMSAMLPLMGALSGCEKLSQKEAEPHTAAETTETKSADASKKSATRDEISDSDIEHAIRHRLYIEGVFPSTLINVKVKEGIVEISGSAFSLFAKNQAEEIIRSTRGVRGYIDTLDVLKVDIEDSELRQRVEQALLLDPATEAYEIKTSVKDGTVQLEGEVDSWTERNLAGEVAASVMGVSKLENNLTMDAPPVRTDPEIKTEIEKSLANDVLVDSALVAVDVKSGAVVLTGLVGSDAERQRAISNSWVAGVSRVTADDLKVEWWDRDRFAEERVTTLIPDVEVKAAIKAALAHDSRVNDDDIKVFVDGGRATLTGEVPGLRSKNLAAETAQNTLGVMRVRNYLKVNPEDDANDEMLKERVERAIILNPYLVTWDGTVTAKNGIVRLEGVVNTVNQKRHVEDVVSRVIGVVHVNNQIDVYLNEMEDRILKDDVKAALFWNIFVAPNDVEVTTEGGRVTLTGEVDSVRAFHEAADAARRAGAEVVYNRLEIEKRS